MKITPKRFKIETEISQKRTITYDYEISKNNENIAFLKFPEEINLNEIAKCITECFNEKDLKARTIKFKFYENEVEIYKPDLQEITKSAVLEKIACQIK